MSEHRDAVVLVLEEARRLGFLGPGPVGAHLDHAAGFAAVLRAGVGGAGGAEVGGVGEAGQAGGAGAIGAGAGGPPRRAADLGSGAGLPGLPLAMEFGETEWVLVDGSARRCAFLRTAVRELGLDDRVSVVEERAEVVGRVEAFRGGFDLVVARAFGPPAVVAECAAPLLAVGGRVVVSEPPGGDPGRWDAGGLAMLGLVPGPAAAAGGAAFQVLEQREPCPLRYPRRVGIPAKRPLF